MSLTVKDRIEQFKRDCKSNDYYTKAIMECNERIEELDVKLDGLGCPNGNTNPKCENARNPYAANKLKPLMEQDAIIKERDDYIKRVNKVNSILMKIINPVDRQLITDLYILKKNHENTADKFHYANRSSMHKHVDRVLSKIFEEYTL